MLFVFTSIILWSQFLLEVDLTEKKKSVIRDTHIFKRTNECNSKLYEVYPTRRTTCFWPTLPQVSKGVSICTESPPHFSHAGPCQLCALLFCQSADGNHRDNYTPASRSINMLVVKQGGWVKWQLPIRLPTKLMKHSDPICEESRDHKKPPGGNNGLIIQQFFFSLKRSLLEPWLNVERFFLPFW